MHSRVTEQEFCRRERWDLERVRLLLEKLPIEHHDVTGLKFVLDRADKDGFLTVQYKFPKGKSCGRVYALVTVFSTVRSQLGRFALLGSTWKTIW